MSGAPTKPLLQPAYTGDHESSYFFRAVLMLSGSFFLVYSAFSAIQNMEGSFVKGGPLAVSILYFVFAASCVVGPMVVDKMGMKFSLFAAFMTLCLFCVGNVIAVQYRDVHNITNFVLVPTAAVFGFGASFLWTAQGSYLTLAAQHYGLSKGLGEKAALGTFSGIFWGIFQCTQLSGNLISSIVLEATKSDKYPDGNAVVVFLVYSVFAVAGTAMILFLPALKPLGAGGKSVNDDEPKKTPGQAFQEVIELWRDSRMLWIMPLLVLSGIEQAFVWFTYTSDYVEVGVGKDKIGYLMAVFGTADALGSVTMGKLSDRIGRVPVLIMGFSLQLAVVLSFLRAGQPNQGGTFWTWGGDGYGTLVLAAIMWGFGDAVWNTQITALLGDLFSDNTNPAFANLKLWQSLAIAAPFLYGSSVSAHYQLIINLIALIVGGACALRVAALARDAKPKSLAGEASTTEIVYRDASYNTAGSDV